MRGRLLVALVLAAAPLTGCLQPSLVGEPAPAFRLTTSEGEVVNETTHLGRWVVLDLMATWCGPCKLEVQHLKEVQRVHGDGVVILSVGVDPQESVADLQRFADEHGSTWPFALDADGALGEAYNLGAIPKLVIIDPDGRVAFEQGGEVLPAAIHRVVDPTGAPPADALPILPAAAGLVLGFLAWFNPYRRFHRDSGRAALDAGALALFTALGVLAWRFSGVVSTRATLSSLLFGALTLGAAGWWLRARRQEAQPPEARPFLEVGDRVYEGAPHFALALVLGLGATGGFGFFAPLAAFVLGAGAALALRERVRAEQRVALGLLGLVLAGAGLLVFGSRFLFAAL